MSNVHPLRQMAERHPAPQSSSPDINDVRTAVFEDAGEDGLAQAACDRYERDNDGLYRAQADIRRGDARVAQLDQEKQRFTQLLRKTDIGGTRVTAEQETRMPLFQRTVATAGIALAGIALYMGNQVGVSYITHSGLDMYATDEKGAALFMGAALLGSAALKAIEARLASDSAKALYFTAVSLVGVWCLLIWVVTLALVFAPDTGGAAAWLLNGVATTRTTTIALLLGHIGADICLGFATFASAESVLMGDRKRVRVDNPAYLSLRASLDTLEKELTTEQDAIAAAEDFLRRYEAGRRVAENDARIAFRRESRRESDARTAATATARSQFLTKKGV